MERRTLIRIALGLAVTLGLPILLVGGALASAFRGNTALEDGRSFADGKITTVVDGFVACYLIDAGHGGYVLIDSCNDPEGAALSAALSARGADLSSVTLVLLTHGHGDHIGGLAAMPDATVRAMAAEIPLLEGTEAYGGPMSRLAGAQDSGVRVTEPLVDREVFTVGTATITAFAVPGHTPGSAAYLVHGVLMLGDSAGYKTSGALAGAPWVFSDDTALNLHSLGTLAATLEPRASKISWPAPAHTGPAQSASALMAHAP